MGGVLFYYFGWNLVDKNIDINFIKTASRFQPPNIAQGYLIKVKNVLQNQQNIEFSSVQKSFFSNPREQSTSIIDKR